MYFEDSIPIDRTPRRIRFIDWEPIGFVDDEEFESKHPRKDNGQFGKGGNTKNQSNFPKNKKEYEERIRKKSLEKRDPQDVQKSYMDHLPELLDRLLNGNVKRDPRAEPTAILREATELLVGTYEASFPDHTNTTLIIGFDFVNEGQKYMWTTDRPPRQRPLKEQREIARRQLAGYSHVMDLIKNGFREKEWRLSNHHPDKEFISCYHRYIFDALSKIFIIDVMRDIGQSDQPAEAYHVTSQGNPGFRRKAKAMGKGVRWSDGTSEAILVRVYIR